MVLIQEGFAWINSGKTKIKQKYLRFAEVLESAFFMIWHLIIAAIRFLKNV